MYRPVARASERADPLCARACPCLQPALVADLVAGLYAKDGDKSELTTNFAESTNAFDWCAARAAGFRALCGAG